MHLKDNLSRLKWEILMKTFNVNEFKCTWTCIQHTDHRQKEFGSTSLCSLEQYHCFGHDRHCVDVSRRSIHQNRRVFVWKSIFFTVNIALAIRMKFHRKCAKNCDRDMFKFCSSIWKNWLLNCVEPMKTLRALSMKRQLCQTLRFVGKVTCFLFRIGSFKFQFRLNWDFFFWSSFLRWTNWTNWTSVRCW